MAIALPLLVHLFEPVQAMVHWLAGGAPAAPRNAADRDKGLQPGALPLANERAASVGSPTLAKRTWEGPTRSSPCPSLRSGPVQRPLRIVRVIDPRGGRSAAGRMVISGRMADVCAEIDRLADLDSRH